MSADGYSFAYSDGFNSSPLPFACSITPRSKEHADIIKKEYQDAMKQLSQYKAVINKVS
jgi:hypothetical protein